MSNACYRVETPGFEALLYRKFECQIVDRDVEAIIFRRASEQHLGPKLIFQNANYRIEEFLDARPLSIWEMRNPEILRNAIRTMFEFNTNNEMYFAMKQILPKESVF